MGRIGNFKLGLRQSPIKKARVINGILFTIYLGMVGGTIAEMEGVLLGAMVLYGYTIIDSIVDVILPLVKFDGVKSILGGIAFTLVGDIAMILFAVGLVDPKIMLLVCMTTQILGALLVSQVSHGLAYPTSIQLGELLTDVNIVEASIMSFLRIIVVAVTMIFVPIVSKEVIVGIAGVLHIVSLFTFWNIYREYRKFETVIW